MAPLASAMRRHSPFIVLFTVAIGVRLCYSIVYPYAFFFPDTIVYVRDALNGTPDRYRTAGYGFLIQPLAEGPYEHLAWIQHVIGVALVAAGYFFLVRRGAKPWLAALALAPLALDARQLTLEHYILAETAYVGLTLAGLFVLAWRDRLGVVAAAAGGALLGGAALTRSVGMPVLALAVVYILVRKAGWKPLVSFALPVAALLGSYLMWHHSHTGVYAFSEYGGRFLYARVMPVADCSKLELSAEQRKLCDPNPMAMFDQRPDRYIWSPYSPAKKYFPDFEDDKFLNEFATTVIKQRPGAFLGMVGKEMSWYFLPSAPLNHNAQCLADLYLPPREPGAECQAPYYTPVSEPGKWPTIKAVPESQATRLFATYGEYVTFPGPVYAVGILMVLAAAFWRVRGRSWRPAADTVLFGGAGVGLMVVGVGASLFEYRYALPAVSLVPIGMALAWVRLRSAPPAAPATVSSTPDTDMPTSSADASIDRSDRPVDEISKVTK